MRKSLLTLLCLFVLGTSASAREFDWAIVDSLEFTSNPFWIHSGLSLTPAGEPVRVHMVQKHALHSSTYLGDFRVAQYDQSGSVIWSTLLEGKVHVEDLQVDSTGAIVLHGTYLDTLQVDPEHMLLDGSGVLRAYLLKLDPTHQVEWLIDLHTMDPSIHDVEVITVDPNDQVWVGTSRFDGDSEILRLDAHGQVIETYNQGSAPYVTGLAVEADGTVWATGFCSDLTLDFNGAQYTCPFHYASYLVKYSPNGVAEWAQFIEDITFQGPHLISDKMGGVYIAGTLNGFFDFGGFWPEEVDFPYDFWLCRVDADGNFLWLREVPADDFEGGGGGVGKSAFLACPNGASVYFTGYSRDDVDWLGGGNPPPSWGSHDVVVMEYSAAGECLWAKTAGSWGVDFADAVAVDAEGNVFVVGMAHDGVDFDGMVFPGNWNNTFIASLPAELSAAPETAREAGAHLSIYPNPFNPSTRIHYTLAEAGSVTLTLHDMRGARLATLATGHRARGEYFVEWNGRDRAGHNLPSGIFFARLETAHGILSRRLVMIR